MGVLRGVAQQPGTAVSVGAADTPVSTGAKSSAGTRYFSNDHATQVIYLRLAVSGAAANSGIRLGPGQTIIIESYTGPISAFASGAATPLLIAEV